jgi:hypothetical protein
VQFNQAVGNWLLVYSRIEHEGLESATIAAITSKHEMPELTTPPPTTAKPNQHGLFQGGPQLGEVEAGFVAALIGAPLSVVVGGLGSILSALAAALKGKSLINYESEL